MLKTISAALLAASVIAAPSFAAEASKTTGTAPTIKADQSQTKAATTAADVKTDAKVDGKSSAMNANAAAKPDEHKTAGKHHHQDKQVSEKQSQKVQPDVTKPGTTDKRN
ncbi:MULTISPECIES: His-rich protein BRANT [Bradyrhizobium]|jgi:hypothetical protein|uniref:His-rich protein BRANT n=1 Tax=Bradyrhizobium TaxID=374 RepID=UPI001BAD8585|nr:MULTISPECIES: hypothetical protein [Bradyrhizobium]MBR0815597.1 hypothetical protein [Bradyrhizobium diazoefficiens]WOH76404.1 hypothetical protein RX330_15455 [Bradyrhizobium sp. NDS-1]